MEHVVFFTSPEGASLFRRTPDLDAAVRVVEHLRNVDGVEDARVYSLSAVPLAFKTYVRVEVSGAEPAAEAEAEPEPEPAPEPVAEVEPEPVAEAEPVAEVEPEPVADAEPVAEVEAEEFHPVPGMDVLPSDDLVGAEPRNGKARGMGFFSR